MIPMNPRSAIQRYSRVSMIAMPFLVGCIYSCSCHGLNSIPVLVVLGIVGIFIALGLYTCLEGRCHRKARARAPPVDTVELGRKWLFLNCIPSIKNKYLVSTPASPIDPYRQMSTTLDKSLVEKDDSYNGPALPEPTHVASPPPSYHRGSRESVRIPEGYSCGSEEEPSAISPPSLVHPVN
jgi:hypothetical protein